jgi:hypothetical protein
MAGRDANCLEFRLDGNLVLCSSAGVPLMDWKAEGMGGEILALQDDGNLVLYAQGQAIWASDRLKDGRVIIRDPAGSLGASGAADLIPPGQPLSNSAGN